MPRTYFLKTLNDVQTRTRGSIPHWELAGATYSVTFRLHGSLPTAVVARLHEERRRLERAITGGARPLTGIEDLHLRAQMETLYDEAIHTNVSVAHLSNPDVRKPGRKDAHLLRKPEVSTRRVVDHAKSRAHCAHGV
jgi:hypothetical protein